MVMASPSLTLPTFLYLRLALHLSLLDLALHLLLYPGDCLFCCVPFVYHSRFLRFSSTRIILIL
ncbi:uncharacterized protein STEHIDRAFT_141065 [Stereum hirsutum FP-91666 SS1]|uniref:uncharacterized protein n=1 Tax=Stereum hirsutum (strain FP-91666) TaxID=721885 RepID=UPI0004449A77|nr:uncharacterized protein STEHIDRAFT_141065 [Stereum hirsutum FP-91666 SS1]EIM83231.1 hypothetical protein STEHIDRAFT_141065 [Stereum hirsutum FP-91666 SS1]